MRIDFRPIIEQMVNLHWDEESAKQKIKGKFFLFAHHLWLNNHLKKIFSLRSLIETEDHDSFITSRKAYTITKLPKFFVFN
mmetsp:Transcript_3501/g.3247  ORF Transcript_3501/g.3247 Transcript_3501/m.3247 type:complete len:81 (+) Transcript_3501:162-404(+)